MTQVTKSILTIGRCKSLGMNKDNSLHNTFKQNEVFDKVIDILYNHGTGKQVKNCVLDLEDTLKLIQYVYQKNEHRIDIRFENEAVLSLIMFEFENDNVTYTKHDISEIKDHQLEMGVIGLWEREYYLKNVSPHLTITFNTGLNDKAFLTLNINILDI